MLRWFLSSWSPTVSNEPLLFEHSKHQGQCSWSGEVRAGCRNPTPRYAWPRLVLMCDSQDLTFHAMLSDELVTVRWTQISTSVLPLGLIGNASCKVRCEVLAVIWGVFDKQARRKPLAFAAGAGDAAGYGIWMGVFSPFVRGQMWMHFQGCGEETQIRPHTSRIISRAASAAPAASFLPVIRQPCRDASSRQLWRSRFDMRGNVHEISRLSSKWSASVCVHESHKSRVSLRPSLARD